MAGREGPHSLSAPEEQLEGCQHQAHSTGHPQSNPDCSELILSTPLAHAPASHCLYDSCTLRSFKDSRKS